MSKTILRPHFLKNCNSWLISQPREGLLPAATNTNIKIQMQMQMQDTTKQIQKYDLTSFLEKLQQLIDITAQRKVIASCNKYKYKNTKIQMQMQDTTKTNTKIRPHLISQKAATTDWYHSPEKRYCQLQQNKWLHPREILQMVFWKYQIFCSNVPILVKIWNILITIVESFFYRFNPISFR